MIFEFIVFYLMINLFFSNYFKISTIYYFFTQIISSNLE